ncbi:hypothetical protein BGW42_005378 [Actinomortierella wolfii]|nr:hypothetical protein BGW42_005378 [Actinomortierella wolfii]
MFGSHGSGGARQATSGIAEKTSTGDMSNCSDNRRHHHPTTLPTFAVSNTHEDSSPDEPIASSPNTAGERDRSRFSLTVQGTATCMTSPTVPSVSLSAHSSSMATTFYSGVKLAPPIVSAHVSGPEKRTSDQRVWYTIQVQPCDLLVPVMSSSTSSTSSSESATTTAIPRKPYNIYRRYEDVAEFADQLEDEFPSLGSFQVPASDQGALERSKHLELPRLANRLVLFVTKAVCQQRKEDLDRYLQELFALGPILSQSRLVSEFFGIWKTDMEVHLSLKDGDPLALQRHQLHLQQTQQQQQQPPSAVEKSDPTLSYTNLQPMAPGASPNLSTTATNDIVTTAPLSLKPKVMKRAKTIVFRPEVTVQPLASRHVIPPWNRIPTTSAAGTPLSPVSPPPGGIPASGSPLSFPLPGGHYNDQAESTGAPRKLSLTPSKTTASISTAGMEPLRRSPSPNLAATAGSRNAAMHSNNSNGSTRSLPTTTVQSTTMPQLIAPWNRQSSSSETSTHLHSLIRISSSASPNSQMLENKNGAAVLSGASTNGTKPRSILKNSNQPYSTMQMTTTPMARTRTSPAKCHHTNSMPRKGITHSTSAPSGTMPTLLFSETPSSVPSNATNTRTKQKREMMTGPGGKPIVGILKNASSFHPPHHQYQQYLSPCSARRGSQDAVHDIGAGPNGTAIATTFKIVVDADTIVALQVLEEPDFVLSLQELRQRIKSKLQKSNIVLQEDFELAWVPMNNGSQSTQFQQQQPGSTLAMKKKAVPLETDEDLFQAMLASPSRKIGGAGLFCLGIIGLTNDDPMIISQSVRIAWVTTLLGLAIVFYCIVLSFLVTIQAIVIITAIVERQQLDNVLDLAWGEAYELDPQPLQDMEIHFQCCGFHTIADCAIPKRRHEEDGPVDPFACRDLPTFGYSQPCQQALLHAFRRHQTWLFVLLLATELVQVVALLAALVLHTRLPTDAEIEQSYHREHADRVFTTMARGHRARGGSGGGGDTGSGVARTTGAVSDSMAAARYGGNNPGLSSKRDIGDLDIPHETDTYDEEERDDEDDDNDEQQSILRNSSRTYGATASLLS